MIGLKALQNLRRQIGDGSKQGVGFGQAIGVAGEFGQSEINDLHSIVGGQNHV